jgi:hypothetical protein
MSRINRAVQGGQSAWAELSGGIAVDYGGWSGVTSIMGVRDVWRPRT